MNEIPVWSCEFKEFPQGPALNALTVGSKFTLNCHGDLPVQWAVGTPVTPVFPQKEQAYSLAILENPRLEANQATFTVTGYKAGKHEPEYLRFVQGERGFEFVKPKWEIQSVLKQGEQPQPYPPFGPWALGMPLWFLVALVAAALVSVYLVIRALRRRNQRRRMLDELKLHRTALTPLHQFYRDSRLLRRKIHNARNVEELRKISEELNREFRLYVLRQFQIPALDWSDGEILGDLKKRHRHVYRHASETLKRTLRELFRMKGREGLLLHDVEQLHRMSLEAVEKLDSVREARR
jgi:hypothetical protein